MLAPLQPFLFSYELACQEAEPGSLYLSGVVVSMEEVVSMALVVTASWKAVKGPKRLNGAH